MKKKTIDKIDKWFQDNLWLGMLVAGFVMYLAVVLLIVKYCLKV